MTTLITAAKETTVADADLQVRSGFRPFGSHFGLKISGGGGGAGSPGPSPGSDTELGLKVSVLGYCAHR